MNKGNPPAHSGLSSGSKTGGKDHRQIGQELDLFSFHDVAPGAVFWHPKGWFIYQEIKKTIRSILNKSGYQEIKTPTIVKNSLFKRSGHWQHFGKNNMFNVSIWEDAELSEIIGLVEDTIEKMNLTQGKHGPLTVDIKYRNEIFPVRIENVEWIDSKSSNGITIQKSSIINGISFPVNYTLKPMNCPESTLIYNSKTRSYWKWSLRTAHI